MGETCNLRGQPDTYEDPDIILKRVRYLVEIYRHELLYPDPYKPITDEKVIELLESYRSNYKLWSTRNMVAWRLIESRLLEIAREFCSPCGNAVYEYDGCAVTPCKSCNSWFRGICHRMFTQETICHAHVLTCSCDYVSRAGIHWSPDGDIYI